MNGVFVKDVMTVDVIFAQAPGKKAEAIRLLAQNRISGLPVVKKGTHKLVGIITRKNIFDHPHEDQIALIMTKNPVSVHPDMPLRDAIAIMEEKNLRRMPVVDQDRLVGILTAMDILKVIAQQQIETPIEELVKGPCMPVWEKTPVRVVASIFQLSSAYALPVVNSRSRVVGIVTDYDLFGLTSINTRTVVSTMGLADDEEAWNYEGLKNLMKLYYEMSSTKLPNIAVEKVMVRNPVSVFMKTGASEAAKRMKEHNFRQLPVKDSSDHLKAMLFDMDLLSVLLR
jgi:predicted transcriptional regulator